MSGWYRGVIREVGGKRVAWNEGKRGGREGGRVGTIVN